MPNLLERLQYTIALKLIRIIEAKPGGIVRPTKKDEDPYGSDLLLVASLYKSSSYLDVSLDVSQAEAQLNLDFKRVEPGLIKFFLVRLPSQIYSRPLGITHMNTYWLNTSPNFDLYADAKEAFDKA